MERGSAPAKLTVPGAAVHGQRYSSAVLCSATTARAQGKVVPGHTAHRPLSLVCWLSVNDQRIPRELGSSNSPVSGLLGAVYRGVVVVWGTTRPGRLCGR